MLHKLIFRNTPEDRTLLCDYVYAFQNPLAYLPLVACDPSSTPQALVSHLAVDYAHDDINVGSFVAQLPNIKALSLSTTQANRVFGRNTYQISPFAQSTIPVELSLLNVPSSSWPASDATPSTSRITRLILTAGVQFDGVSWEAFPSVLEVAVPMASVDWNLVASSQSASSLELWTVFLPPNLSEQMFVSWVDQLRLNARLPLLASIRFLC